MAIRLRVLFAVVLAALLAAFLLFWAWSAVESARLDRAFDTLEARGEPLDVAALPRPTATPAARASSRTCARAG